MADAGYESLENYLYLERNGQMCFIKPANYDQKRTRKFQKQVGRIENMKYDPEEDSFTCAPGKEAVSEAGDNGGSRTDSLCPPPCTGVRIAAAVPCRAQCCRAKDPDRPKELVLKKNLLGEAGAGREEYHDPSEGSICVFAALFRWKAPLVC